VDAEGRSGFAGALRYDGLFWRRLAYLGSVYGPEWWRRGSPPVIAALLFALIGRNRRAVIENLRQVHGSRGFVRDHREALRTFVEFAYVFEETLEAEGHDVHGAELDEKLDLDIRVPPGFDPNALFEGDRGLVVLTSHFGSWEIGARVMQKLDRPVNLVMATEANRTVERFNTSKRERHGLRVIHSDSSLFASVEMIRALRRGEIVAIQLDRAGPGQVTRAVEFFGKPAEFQVGPFALARAADVPLWPVFVARLGRRVFDFLPEPTRRIPRGASDEELFAVMRDVVRSFEGHVRAHPHQWFQFHRVWGT